MAVFADFEPYARSGPFSDWEEQMAGSIRRQGRRLVEGCPMSDEDAWKRWYQSEQPSAGGPGSDATHDMTMSSRMPPAPGNAPGAGGGRGAWPEQPPPSSPGGPGSPYGGSG